MRTLAAILVCALAVPLSAHAQPGPLTDAQRQALAALRGETLDVPREHYVTSNEWRHDLLATPLAGLGGALVGVGADQNYTIAAMAQSELVFCVDYDPYVPLVHLMYSALVPASDTPDALVARFAEGQEAEGERLIRATLGNHADVERVVRLFRGQRARLFPYLTRMRRWRHGGRAATWLADPGYYAHVRALHRNGRIVARAGDVTGATTMRSVGETAQRVGVPIRVVYFSNAEQFFPYTPQFIENIGAMGQDARAVVVRTVRHPRLPNAEHDRRWHYVIEDLAHFRDGLRAGRWPRSFQLVGELVSSRRFGADGISRMPAR